MKKVLYLIYIVLITAVILEFGVRLFTTKNPAEVDLFMNQKHRYLLPLPTDAARFYAGATTETENDGYRVFDDTLGWSHKPWGFSNQDFPCFADNKGLRIGKAAYDQKLAEKSRYHILAIGNSFTHGDAVAAEDSWPFLMEQKSGMPVGNLGVGGYGIQQALLRLMYANIQTDTVLFGVIWGDFERALEPVYTFYQGGNKTRPVFDFQEDGPSLINVPVLTPRQFYDSKKAHNLPIYKHIQGFNQDVFSDALWTKSYFLRLIYSVLQQKKTQKTKPIYLTDDADLEHCMQIFQLFYDFCQKNGVYGKIVLLDTGQNFWHKETFKLDNPWQLVEQKLTARNIPFVDFHEKLYEAYIGNRSNLIHPVENLHYSPAGNKLVSELLLHELNLPTKN